MAPAAERRSARPGDRRLSVADELAAIRARTDAGIAPRATVAAAPPPDAPAATSPSPIPHTDRLILERLPPVGSRQRWLTVELLAVDLDTSAGWVVLRVRRLRRRGLVAARPQPGRYGAGPGMRQRLVYAITRAGEAVLADPATRLPDPEAAPAADPDRPRRPALIDGLIVAALPAADAKRWMTSDELAARVGCSRAWLRKRVALLRRGGVVKRRTLPTGGPPRHVYALAAEDVRVRTIRQLAASINGNRG